MIFSNSQVVVPFFVRATRYWSCFRVNYTESRRFSVPPGAIAENQSTKKRYVCDTDTWTQSSSIFFLFNFVDPVNGYNYSIKGLLYPTKRLMFSLIGLLFSCCLFSASCWNSCRKDRLIKNMSDTPDKIFHLTTKKIKVKTVINNVGKFSEMKQGTYLITPSALSQEPRTRRQSSAFLHMLWV